jgi:hypothetical protein
LEGDCARGWGLLGRDFDPSLTFNNVS